eukprot:365396-Chlamydomonas_euryale.AAC.9
MTWNMCLSMGMSAVSQALMHSGQGHGRLCLNADLESFLGGRRRLMLRPAKGLAIDQHCVHMWIGKQVGSCI